MRKVILWVIIIILVSFGLVFAEQNYYIKGESEKEVIAKINSLYPQLNADLHKIIVKIKIKKGYDNDNLVNALVIMARNYHKPEVIIVPPRPPRPRPKPLPIKIPIIIQSIK